MKQICDDCGEEEETTPVHCPCGCGKCPLYICEPCTKHVVTDEDFGGCEHCTDNDWGV